MASSLTQGKLDSEKGKLVQFQRELETKQAALAEMKPELKKAKTLQGVIERLETKIGKQEFTVQKIELDLMKERLVALQAQVQAEEVAVMDVAFNAADSKTLNAIVARAHMVLSLGATKLVLTKELTAAEDFLRKLVESNPHGWTFNENPLRRYKYVRLGRLTIVLQDSPAYDITFRQLVDWIGKEAAMKYAKVDVSALVKAIKAGDVEDMHCATVKEKDWLKRRTRTVGKPKVVIKEEDPLGRTQVMVVDPELLGLTLDELESATALTGAEIGPLKAHGLSRVAEIRGFSGDQLQAITGIGSVRAKRLIDEVSQLSQTVGDGN
jgi:hypothetical protein